MYSYFSFFLTSVLLYEALDAHYDGPFFSCFIPDFNFCFLSEVGPKRKLRKSRDLVKTLAEEKQTEGRNNGEKVKKKRGEMPTHPCDDLVHLVHLLHLPGTKRQCACPTPSALNYW